MQFNQLDDARLVEEVKVLVKQERNLVIEILRYLREIESRAIFLARGYPSLFEFCVTELGYSNSEAHVRIQAMRLLRTMPSVEEKIEKGDLSLTVAAAAQGTFRRQEKISGVKINTAEKTRVLDGLCGISSRDAEKKLIEHFPEAAPPKESVRAISGEEARITFVASTGLVEKLERLKGLLAHTNFEGRLDVLVEQMADLALEKLDPERRTLDELKTDEVPLGAPQVKKRSRYISADVKSVVWKRAQNQCQYVDSTTGRRCSSRHGLQIDHIKEFSKGGSNNVSNLRLLCGAHNRWRFATSLAPPNPDGVDHGQGTEVYFM